MRRNKRGGGGGKRGVQPLLHVPWVSFWQGQHHHQPFPRLTAKHIRAAYCSPVVHINPPSFAWDYSPQLFLYNTDKVSKTNWAFTENSKKVKTELGLSKTWGSSSSNFFRTHSDKENALIMSLVISSKSVPQIYRINAQIHQSYRIKLDKLEYEVFVSSSLIHLFTSATMQTMRFATGLIRTRSNSIIFCN